MYPGTSHKLLITGTGRAGTTFLVRLLTELGLDTGFDGENWRSSYDEHCHAGLEHTLDDPASPYVLKNPEFCRSLPARLRAGAGPAIDHVLIPIRDLQTAARSRICIGGKDGEIPGGLWLTSDPTRQASALAEAFHELLEALVVHDVPHTLLPFPRFVMEPEFTFSKLRPLLGTTSFSVFRNAFLKVAEPGLIHVYAGDDRTTDSRVAQAYRERRTRERAQARWDRLRRRTWRIAAGVLATAGLGSLYLFGGK